MNSFGRLQNMDRYNRGVSTNIYHMVTDCLFSAIYFCVLYYFYRPAGDYNRYLLIYLSFLFIYVSFNFATSVYNLTTFFYIDRVLRNISTSYLLALAITFSLCFFVGNSDLNFKFYISFVIIFYIAILTSAFFIRLIVKHTHLFARRTLLVGKIRHFTKFCEYLEKSNLEYNILGYVSVDETCASQYLGTLGDLEQIIRTHVVDQVFIMHRKSYHLDISPYVDLCMEMGITVQIIMNSYKPQAARHYVSNVGTYPILTYHRVYLGTGALLIKRLIDIVGSLVGIICLSPVMLVTAIAIKLDSKGPVLFKQVRVGQNGRHFHMYKFRSMCVDAEEKKKDLIAQNEMESNFMFKIKDDPRITRVGHFIRRTSIDELPQFFNVLIGNMSLVGTRPPTLDEVDLYNRSHWRRISIKPGITGMWQVSGRSSIRDFDKIVELDTEYIDNWNVFLDFKIIIKTILSIFQREGAF